MNYREFNTHAEASGYIGDVVGELDSIAAFSLLCDRLIMLTLCGKYIIDNSEQMIKAMATIANDDVKNNNF